MRYLLLIYGDERAWDDETRESCYRESAELAHQLKTEGHYLGAMVLNFAVMESLLVLLVLTVILLTWPAPPWDVIVYGGIALAIVAPLAFFPLAKLLWLAIDLYIQPEL